MEEERYVIIKMKITFSFLALQMMKMVANATTTPKHHYMSGRTYSVGLDRFGDSDVFW